MNPLDFKEIMASYEQEEQKNKHILAQRREEIRRLIPEYFTIEQNIASSAKDKVAFLLADDANQISSDSISKDISNVRKKCNELLLEHGFPIDYLEPIYTCPICRDKGYIDGRKKCQCLRQKIADSLYEHSGISDILETENFEHVNRDYFTGDDLLNFENNYQKALNFAKNFGSDYRNLFFYGTVGTGKSFLSCCIAKELIEQGYQVVYYSANQLFEKFELYRFSEQKLEALESVIFDCDLLILDDLATEVSNDYIKSKLFSLLNERFIAMKPTIISSNVPPQELVSHYSERVFSRIVSQYELLECTGPDLRIIKAKLANKRK